jgi:hypothetical protein
MLPVAGFCPMGCGQTLYLGEGGSVVCASNCPRPSAVSELLSDPETEHVVVVDSDGWSAKHPLRERIGDVLLTCGLSDAVLAWTAPGPGRYRVHCSPGDPPMWVWVPLPPA